LAADFEQQAFFLVQRTGHLLPEQRLRTSKSKFKTSFGYGPILCTGETSDQQGTLLAVAPQTKLTYCKMKQLNTKIK